MLSMSGFGSGSASGSRCRYKVECASVNRKGLEIVVTLPRPLASLEPKVRQEAQQHVLRGRLHILVTEEALHSSKNFTTKIDLNAGLEAFQELQQLQRALKLTDPIKLEALLQIPGVLSMNTSEPSTLLEAWTPLQEALQKALHSLRTMRIKEGKNLVSDLKKRFRLLEQLTKKIETRTPHILAYRRTQLQTRLKDLGAPVSEKDPSLLRELILIAERSNISEELIRLQSHLNQSREMLLESTSTGRSLDYLAQEMFREFNTLSNKANDAEVSHWVVQSKSELDQIREQLANFE
jgi:uncharacterized protein (TIGR00255 family)